MGDSALVDAQMADFEIAAGKRRGPLHGVPIALKDLCWTKGVKTAAGMRIYENFVPTVDGTAVKKLRAAGAVLIGKLQMTESAYADHHPSAAPAVNPWNAAHRTGVVERFGCRHCGGPLLRLARHRHRGFHSLPFGRQRPDQVEADVGPRQPL